MAPAIVSNVDLALQLAGRGWFVFPCRPDKTPYTKHGKDDATDATDLIRSWWGKWPDALIGIYCEKSGFFAVDLDVKDGRDGARAWAELVETYGAGQPVAGGPAQKTPSGGYHMLFRLPEGLAIPNNANKLGPGLDLRSNGYICTGGPYEWLPDHDHDQPLTNAPAWLLERIGSLSKKPAKRTLPSTPAIADHNQSDYWLKKALQRSAPGSRNDTGFWLACQLRDMGMTEAEAESMMLDYAAGAPGDGYGNREALASLRQAFKSVRREPVSLPGVQTSVYSSDNGRGPTADIPNEPGKMPALSWPDEEIHLTDMGNARRFALQHAGRACYTNAWGWLVWDGRRWKRDDSGQVMRLARETVKRLYREAERALGKAQAAIRTAEKAAGQEDITAIAGAQKTAKDAERLANALLSWAIKSQGRARIEAMIALAQSEPEISAQADEFDKDPELLNVLNGVLDLRTGELIPHSPGLKLTKLAGASYDPSASCPTWLKFLDRIFSGSESLIGFLQRAAGYSLTGDVREQSLFFLYGTGANGKSTFTGALQAIMGDYSMKVRAETLMVKKGDSVPEELAQLAGVRFMLAAELGEGQRLNESLIKDLTGYTDKIRARLLYRESFEFFPSSKPWLYGNHKPIIRGTDEGIWRRPKLIPFLVAIPEDEQDKDLPNKLRAELDGILTWCVCGCLEWRKSGLQTPAEVTAATAQFRAEQDILAAFLDECCVINKLATVTAGALYTAYKSWAEQGGLSPVSKIAFSRSLEERGFTTRGPDGKVQRLAGSGQAFYIGLGLLKTDEETSQDL